MIQQNFENIQSPILDSLFLKLSEHDITDASSLNQNSFNTKYFSPDEFTIRHNSDNDFSILNISIRSMQKNFETFREFYKSLNFLFDVICLTETWEDPKAPITSNSIYDMPFYDLVSQPRSIKKGGGTAIYVLKSLSYELRKQHCSLSKHIECLAIEISNKTGKNMYITCIYRPPDGSIIPFIRALKSNYFDAVKKDKNVFIAGDFNIDALKYNKFKTTKSFFDDLLEKNIYPAIHRPTRVTQNSFSIIDNIFSNTLINDSFKAGIIKTDISDHFPTFLICNNAFNLSRNLIPKTVLKRKLTKVSLDRFKYALESTSWDCVLNINDTNIAYTLFSEKIKNVFDTSCPISKVKIKQKQLINPWMTNGLKKSSKRKQKLYNKFLKSRTNLDNENYKNYKKIFQKLLIKAKSNYFSGLLNQHKGDSKKVWRIVNEVVGRKKTSNDCLPKTIKQSDGFNIQDKHKICTECLTSFL